MIVRLFTDADLASIKSIYDRYYSDQFTFEELLSNKILEPLVILDDDGRIITFGGPRTLIELVAVTDLAHSVRKRREGLLKLLESTKYVSEQYGYKELHCTSIENDKWTSQLENYGFHKTKGKVLVTEV